jgi:hypothetical protein
MKNLVLKPVFGLALIALLLSGCDLVDKADDVTFEITLDKTFVADENGTFTNKNYPGDPVLLDLASHTDVTPYLNKIKDVKITKVEYQITSYTSEPPGTAVMFSNGTMRYSETSGGTSSELSTVPGPLNLMTASGVKELPKNDANFNALAKILLDKKQAYVFTVGTLSSTPVSFNVPTTFYITITANALE